MSLKEGPLWRVGTDDVRATIALGRRLGERLVEGLMVGLSGPLGAGKTHFVKGLALGNGLADPNEVSSPTFVLVQEYPGRLRLYHLDVYRLGDAKAVLGLGIEEMAAEGRALVVEWADKFPDVWPSDRLEATITPGPGETDRAFEFRAMGAVAEAVLSRLREAEPLGPGGERAP